MLAPVSAPTRTTTSYVKSYTPSSYITTSYVPTYYTPSGYVVSYGGYYSPGYYSSYGGHISVGGIIGIAVAVFLIFAIIICVSACSKKSG